MDLINRISENFSESAHLKLQSMDALAAPIAAAAERMVQCLRQDGKILACDSPKNLKRTISRNSTFSIETTPFGDVDGLSALRGVTGYSAETVSDRSIMKLVVDDESAISDIISYLTQRNAKIISFSKNEPTLEDVFIKMVGRGLE